MNGRTIGVKQNPSPAEMLPEKNCKAMTKLLNEFIGEFIHFSGENKAKFFSPAANKSVESSKCDLAIGLRDLIIEAEMDLVKIVNAIAGCKIANNGLNIFHEIKPQSDRFTEILNIISRWVRVTKEENVIATKPVLKM